MASGLFNVGIGVGPPALQPVNNVIVLATWTGYIMIPTDVVTFTVMPFPGSVTFPNEPGYIDGMDVSLAIPCGVSSGYPYGAPCAAINTSGIVINDEMSWSGVKALYR